MELLMTGAVQKDDSLIAEIESVGHRVVFVQDERIPPTEQGISPDSFEGVICNGLFLYNKIEDFKKLKYIQLTSAGLDRVPMDYIATHGIKINNARGVYSVPMAEFALCGVLDLYKKSSFFRENQKEHKWEKHRCLEELSGKTVCIVGCGSVGCECAKRFSAFDCNVVGADAFPTENCFFSAVYGMDKLDFVLSLADIVVLTLPLTDETYHIIGEKRLFQMKDGAVLVNISRGGVVDTGALINNLPRLGGAVLDVFEEEPLSESSALWDAENVIVTPHNSFVGNNNLSRLKEVILANLRESETEIKT